ncbi:hypothetical protein B0H12DRAFT_1107275 [Mycena haematopus]|nr:hypothetical protein B0H12DRAFT_1107275 [Mycena haematopus]
MRLAPDVFLSASIPGRSTSTRHSDSRPARLVSSRGLVIDFEFRVIPKATDATTRSLTVVGSNDLAIYPHGAGSRAIPESKNLFHNCSPRLCFRGLFHLGGWTPGEKCTLWPARLPIIEVFGIEMHIGCAQEKHFGASLFPFALRHSSALVPRR